jgi:hypothetical protein
MLIALCQDLGWRDPVPTEAEAVVWLIVEHGYRICQSGIAGQYSYQDEFEPFNWIIFNPVEESTRLGYAVKGDGEG